MVEGFWSDAGLILENDRMLYPFEKAVSVDGMPGAKGSMCGFTRGPGLSPKSDSEKEEASLS